MSWTYEEFDRQRARDIDTGLMIFRLQQKQKAKALKQGKLAPEDWERELGLV